MCNVLYQYNLPKVMRSQQFPTIVFSVTSPNNEGDQEDLEYTIQGEERSFEKKGKEMMTIPGQR